MSKKNILVGDDVQVDLNLVYEVGANDEVFVKRMVQTFLQNMPVTLQELKEAHAQSDWDAVYQKAHFTKSSLSIIKVGTMLDVMKEIVERARTKTNLQEIAALIKKAETLYGKGEQILLISFAGTQPNH